MPAGVRLRRPTSRARGAFPWPAALRLFRRRQHVKPALRSTPADFRSSVRGALRRFCIHALLNQVGNEATLRVPHRGDGRPVMLLPCHPRTNATWHWVAPELDGWFFAVCPDLREYGQSAPPPGPPEHGLCPKPARTSCLLIPATCG